MSDPFPSNGPRRKQPLDIALGARIRALRLAAGLSQGELGRAIGVSYQQVQKYERSNARLSAAMLFAIATALNVPVGSLYEGAANHRAVEAGRPVRRARSGVGDDISARIAVLLQQITDPGIRKHLLALAKALGEGEKP